MNDIVRRIIRPVIAISADPEAMMEYAKATKKQRRREETLQDRENMSKFLNNKYNKRRLK